MPSHPYAQAFANRDVDAAVELFADDVVFHSPVIAEPGFQGRTSVAELLKIVFEVITDEEFFVDVGNDDIHLLVANARVLGNPIKTTTLLEYDANGLIREIWIMARPLVGVVAIAEAVGSGLAARGGAGRGLAVQGLTKPLAGLAALTNRTGSQWIEGAQPGERLNRRPRSGRLVDAV